MNQEELRLAESIKKREGTGMWAAYMSMYYPDEFWVKQVTYDTKVSIEEDEDESRGAG
jgi:hypothetical protein